jgi:hypothetical protein
MAQLKEDEWPDEGEPTSYERETDVDAPPEHSPTPRHSQITGDGLDTQDTQPCTTPPVPRRSSPDSR